VDDALEAFRVPELCLESTDFSGLFWDSAEPQMQQSTLTFDWGYGSLQPAPTSVPDDGIANDKGNEYEGDEWY
jgi:hypothetical protein